MGGKDGKGSIFGCSIHPRKNSKTMHVPIVIVFLRYPFFDATTFVAARHDCCWRGHAIREGGM